MISGEKIEFDEAGRRIGASERGGKARL